MSDLRPLAGMRCTIYIYDGNYFQLILDWSRMSKNMTTMTINLKVCKNRCFMAQIVHIVDEFRLDVTKESR